MSSFWYRIKSAGNVAGVHFVGSLIFGGLPALVVVFLWYPHPYDHLSGGNELVAVLIAVDVVCGPLLTWVMFDPAKSRRELIVDMLLVIFIQFSALGYGLNAVYVARPLYLVLETDRFKVISTPDYDGMDVGGAILALPVELRPKLWSGPIVVGIQLPESLRDRNYILFESMSGGRDYAQRPEYYVPYDSARRQALIARSKALDLFIKHFPTQAADAIELARVTGGSVSQLRFVPVVGKQEWVAVLKPTGEIAGFLPGDGFAVP